MAKKVNNVVWVLLVSAVSLSVNAADFSEDGRPNEHLCPITYEVMRDPVIAVDGHAYEREAIEEWFRRRGPVSPKTGLALESEVLTPNHALKSLIQDWAAPERQGPLSPHRSRDWPSPKPGDGGSSPSCFRLFS